MRIGIDARLVHYTKAGIAQYILQLVRELAKLDSGNAYVLLQHRQDRQPLVQRPNFRRHTLWTPSHHRLEQKALPFEIGRLNLDLLHSPDFIPPFRRNCLSVITVHDLSFLLFPGFMTKESANYYGQIDVAVRNTDHIIAVSQSTSSDLQRLLGVSESKISVIHEAADPLFRPVDNPEAMAAVRSRYGVPDEFVLFVSTIEPRKNLPTLFEAFRLLLDRYSTSAKLVVVGRLGWLVDDSLAAVDRLRLRDHVLFLQQVPPEDLLHLYNAARALVMPSFYEGFGLPALEAMACGTPVVVSNVSSLPEVVGDAGILVSPEDSEGIVVAMWRILSDPRLRDEMRDKGLSRAACFSWNKAARRTLDVYHEVMSQT
jgi:glycosyltransferase involved in cell wall biosynthesis